MTYSYAKSVILKPKGSGAAERLNFGNKYFKYDVTRLKPETSRRQTSWVLILQIKCKKGVKLWTSENNTSLSGQNVT